MKRNTRFAKCFVSLLVVAVMVVMSAQMAFAVGADGNITVQIQEPPGGGTGEPYRTQLADLIQTATDLLNDTRVDVPPGANTPGTEYWAPQAAHTAFSGAIAAAQTVLDNFVPGDGGFAVGDEFDVTVSITGNADGFAGLITRLDIPNGIGLINLEPNNDLQHVPDPNHGSLFASFVGPEPWERMLEDGLNEITPPQTNQSGFDIYAGWVGRATNITQPEGRLFTFTFRVMPGAVAGDHPLYLTFANHESHYHEQPSRATDGGPQEIDLIDITINGSNAVGQRVNIGSVRLR